MCLMSFIFDTNMKLIKPSVSLRTLSLLPSVVPKVLLNHVFWTYNKQFCITDKLKHYLSYRNTLCSMKLGHWDPLHVCCNFSLCTIISIISVCMHLLVGGTSVNICLRGYKVMEAVRLTTLTCLFFVWYFDSGLLFQRSTIWKVCYSEHNPNLNP